MLKAGTCPERSAKKERSAQTGRAILTPEAANSETLEAMSSRKERTFSRYLRCRWSCRTQSSLSRGGGGDGEVEFDCSAPALAPASPRLEMSMVMSAGDRLVVALAIGRELGPASAGLDDVVDDVAMSPTAMLGKEMCREMARPSQ